MDDRRRVGCHRLDGGAFRGERGELRGRFGFLEPSGGAADPARDRSGAGRAPDAGRDRPGGTRPRIGRREVCAVERDRGAPEGSVRWRQLGRATAAAAATTGLSLDAITPVLTTASFKAMGTTVVVAVENPAALGVATAAARSVVDSIDTACSRFRADSELTRLNAAAGCGFVELSDLLDEAIGVALDAAAVTGGLVDPTIGALIQRLGYTVTFDDLPLDGPAIDLEVRSAPGWETVRHDQRARSVALPGGASLDLGAVGKAWASDRAARAAADRIGTGALVACGGDVAVAGPDRPDGWRVRVAESVDARVWQDVMMFDGGLATSGTESRTWRRGGETLHHILDPATGLPAASPWAMASVAAVTCAGANAAATAAIVLGDGAPSWLAGRGLPARLVHRDGSVVTVGRWPGEVTA